MSRSFTVPVERVGGMEAMLMVLELRLLRWREHTDLMRVLFHPGLDRWRTFQPCLLDLFDCLMRGTRQAWQRP